MKTLIKIGVVVAVIAGAFALIPALRGPVNRFKHDVNDKLGQEYIIDNYKEEYVKLNEKKIEIKRDLQKFDVETKVAEKKLVVAQKKANIAKDVLIKTGTTDLKAFNRAKDAFESIKTEVENINVMLGAYSNAVAKLQDSLFLVENTMSKAKGNIATLESKKMVVDSIREVNKTLENINGVGDTDISINVEKLDDDVLRESIKLEALNDTKPTAATTQAEADAYLNSLK